MDGLGPSSDRELSVFVWRSGQWFCCQNDDSGMTRRFTKDRREYYKGYTQSAERGVARLDCMERGYFVGKTCLRRAQKGAKVPRQ